MKIITKLSLINIKALNFNLLSLNKKLYIYKINNFLKQHLEYNNFNFFEILITKRLKL